MGTTLGVPLECASPAATWGVALSMRLVWAVDVWAVSAYASWLQCGALPVRTVHSHGDTVLLQVATSVQAIGLGGIVAWFDWAAEARKAATRVAASKAAAVEDEEEASGLLGGGDRH